MKFPNARKGISKILTAQWLNLISIVLILIGGITAAVFAISAGLISEGSAEAAGAALVSAGVGGAVALAGMVIAVIAIILNLVGLNTARKDDTQFNTAFMLCVISLVLAILAVCLQSVNPDIAGWISFVQKILSLAVIEYVAAGIISLAEQLHNAKTADLGRKLRIIITVLYIIAIILNVFGNAASTMGSIVSTVDAVLELVVFIVYIVLLTKAKKMLA